MLVSFERLSFFFNLKNTIMKLSETYGNLKATVISDADGVNIYTEHLITGSDGLFVRIEGNEPISRLKEELLKVKASAEQLNENFKQL